MAPDLTTPRNPANSPAQELLRRLRSRLSQTEISRRTGIPQPTISRWEREGVADAADGALKLVELEAALAKEQVSPNPEAEGQGA